MNTSQLLIIILLITNLVATVWFGLNNNAPSNVSQAQQVATHELPEAVNSDVREAIYEEFSNAFNVQDYDSLYNMFGPVAKAQITRENAYSEFQKLIKYFHSVESGSFTHSELIDTQGNTNIYMLYYTVKLSDDSVFGSAGTLKVTVAVQGAEYQIYGIRLKAEN